MKDTFVIIPVRNRREITLRCLRHLRDCGDLEEMCVIVVDDGSTDGTSEAVQRESPSPSSFRETAILADWCDPHRDGGGRPAGTRALG
jgi:glycosyltransferase involved in cell wall biosynthesis